jgi:uncharacterized protein YndB with AHSA1/START domain
MKEDTTFALEERREWRARDRVQKANRGAFLMIVSAMPVERVTRTLSIAAPIERVFGLLSSPEQTPRWLVGVRSVKVVTPGEIHVGSETLSRVDALGRTWDARGRCVTLEPPNRIVIETHMGPGLKSRSDSRLRAQSPSETVLDAELAFERPGGALGVLFNAFGARERIESDFDISLQNLRAMLEEE